MNKHTIRKQTMQVGGLTLLSRGFGILRELLIIRYLGASWISDAFFTAYKIPNSLRKVFAEGALSAAYIPTLVQTVHKEGRGAVNSMMTLGFIMFEGAVLALVALITLFAGPVIRFIVPGFSEDQVQMTIPMLQILMPFIFFISSSALLTGALQAVNHFFIPAFGPILLNIVFIAGILVCLHFQLPVTVLCWFVLFGGFVLFVSHLIAYIKLNFSFGSIKKEDIKRFRSILVKFLLCLPAVSIMEVNLFIDTSFASFLGEGTISMMNYANRFVGIPLGVFAVAFSTILLPHVSRVSSYAPKRLRFYLFESTKFVLWVTLPVALMMWFFNEKIFSTLFLSDKFTMAQVIQTAAIMTPFLAGLFFFSINKILLNMYYALHVTWVPAIISAFATAINFLFNWLVLDWLGAVGLAWATTLSAVVQTILFLVVLRYYYKFNLYLDVLGMFLLRYGLQLLLFGLMFRGLYSLIVFYMMQLPEWWTHLLLDKILFWAWVGPLAGLFFLALYFTRNLFGIKIYFMD